MPSTTSTKFALLELMLNILARASVGHIITMDELTSASNLRPDQVEKLVASLLDFDFYSGPNPVHMNQRADFSERLGLPITQEADGSLRVTGKMPTLDRPVKLLTRHTRALVLALFMVGLDEESPVLETLLAQISSDFDVNQLHSLIEVVMPDFAPDVFSNLSYAHMNEQCVEITHVKDNGETTVRTVEPFAVFAERGAWYLSAYCRTAQTMRTFKLERIQSAKVLNEVCRSLDDQIGYEFTSFDHKHAANVARLVFENASDYEPREWPGARERKTTTGQLHLDVPFFTPSWIARKVVSKMGAVKVLFPEEVRNEVVEIAKQHLDQLKNQA